MIIENNGALAPVISPSAAAGVSGGGFAVVNSGGGGVSGVTLKTPDKAMVTLEWIQEINAWACELPQDLVEGGDVVVRVAEGVVSITCS